MAFPLINKVSPEPVEDSLERSARVARRALNTPLAMISWFDPTNGVHQVSSEEGAIDYSGDTRVSQMARDIAEHVVTRKQLWAVSDAGENLILNQTLAVKQSGVVSCISVPIRNTRDDRILGALSCISFTPRAWT
ncbi:GAF domain-containing protein (plasmid) [Sulfitobacter sp. W027]|nr:GAF domain-containing protein [Sulfitobacter sp. W027]|tara:strand:- start:596 stop:1000 length:405 start_codon:yes stop_codon:yes gene_type:complete